jgi:hypothetical protein
MTNDFCAGYADQPWRDLVIAAPGAQVYPPAAFRTEWGPIFHRGRLDGSARLLVLGQDPSTHEALTRRILVGTAGRRAQGFVARLGIGADYVMINTYLYSVYGQTSGEQFIDDPAIAGYRNRWLDAVLAGGRVVAAVSFGHLAAQALEAWPGGARLPHVRATHPTFPDSSSAQPPPGRTPQEQFDAAMRQLCINWNRALDDLAPLLGASPPARYAAALTAQDVLDIPLADLPAGTPAWMASTTDWAVRTGASEEDQRATLTVTVPVEERRWHAAQEERGRPRYDGPGNAR